MTIRVLVCDPIHPDGVKLLQEAGFDVSQDPKIDGVELLRRAGDFDAIVVRGRTKITNEVIAAATALKVVARSGVGLDNIDLEAAKKRDIKVVSTPVAPVTSVAELTIALMISLLRKIPFADQSMKRSQWPKAQLMGRELRGKTLGVVGVGGRIGSEVTKIALNGFGMNVVGYDTVDVTRKSRELGFEVCTSLDSLLEISDIVTIHVPYLPSTHHLIDESRIRKMKKGSLIINASRGDIVDGKALLQAIREERLHGAGLDVFHDEPPLEDWEKQLVALENGLSVCTPHIGAQTLECQRLQSVMVAEEIIKLLGE